MSIVANLISTEGKTLTYKTDPVINIIGISTYGEVTAGSGTFSGKTFRYSTNGITYSSWQTLSLPNITGIVFDEKDIVIFEFQLQRTGLDDTITETITLTDTAGSLVLDETYFNSTVFSEFFEASDLNVLKWVVNVVEKIYTKGNGQIPNYISRENTEDFLDFWTSIAKFFAFYVIYTRQYQNFSQVLELLNEYLIQRSTITSRENILGDLQELLENYYSYISQRGTIHIIDDTDFDNNVDTPLVNGELLRLIDFLQSDEFLFNLHQPEKFGWNLGNSSPLYRGMWGNDSLNKDTKDLYYVINPALTYELTFSINTEPELKVTFEGFDSDKIALDFKSQEDGLALNVPLDIEVFRTDKDTFVRVIIFSHTRGNQSGDLTNLNQGNNLRFNSGHNYLKFSITDTSNVAINPLHLVDVRFAPCFTNYSHGMIQVYNWVSVWLTNNNQSFLLSEVKKRIRRDLIPYNSHLEIVTTDDGSGTDPGVTPPAPTYGWRGRVAECEDFTEVVETMWVGDGETAYCEDDGEVFIWIGDEATAECVTE